MMPPPLMRSMSMQYVRLSTRNSSKLLLGTGALLGRGLPAAGISLEVELRDPRRLEISPEEGDAVHL